MKKKISFVSAKDGSDLFFVKIKGAHYKQIRDLATVKNQTIEEFVIKAIESYVSKHS